jgi:hypothetical protein
MPRRFTIGMLAVVSVICTVLLGLASDIIANNNRVLPTWMTSGSERVWWVLSTLTLVLIVVVLLTQSIERNEQRPALVPRSLMKKPTRRNYRKLYLERLIYRYRDFDMKGFSTRGIYNLEQEHVYVSLDLGPQAPNHISAGLISSLPEQLHTGDHSIWDYMRATKMADHHFAIIGPPGSGKTTLLKHSALTFATGLHRRVKPRMPSRTPILLFLRDLFAYIKDNPDLNLIDLIQRSLMILELAPPDGWLETELRRGRCIIMLDGLDEIADLQTRRQVVTWVERQMAIYARNRFIITSRPLGYRSNPLGGVDVLEVRPFTSSQVKRFIGNWYQAIEVMSSAKNDPGVQENARRGANDLLDRLAKAPSLTELAANPLLLTMIATIHRYRSMLPDRRVDLYKEICEVFLGKRLQAQNLDLELAPTQKQSVLQPLAYQSMLNQQQVISSEDALTWISEPLASISQQMDEAAFLRQIEESSGLLLERESGSYSFAHKTFQEYLAAMHIRDERLESDLIAKVEDPWWHETILLYAAQKDASDILEACFLSGNPSIRALSLAKECLREAHSIKPAVRAKVVEFFKHNTENDNAQSRTLAAEVLIISRLGRLVRLDEHRQIDTTLVTHAEYQLFLDESRALGKYYQPDHWPDVRFLAGQGQLPIAGVRPSDAQAFCAWLTERDGEWRYSLPRSGTDELVYNAPVGSTGYWAEGDSGYVCEGQKPGGSERLRALFEQSIDDDLVTLQVYGLIALLDDIRIRLRDLVSDRARDLTLQEQRQAAILIAGDLEIAQHIGHECPYAQDSHIDAMIARACAVAREIARGFDQAVKAAGESARAREAAPDQALRLADESDRARVDALTSARSLLRTLSSSSPWMADLRQAMSARLPQQSALDETIPKLLRLASGRQRELFRALASAGSSTRAQVLSRLRAYIYTPLAEQIQALGDRQGFGIDHTYALECLRVFERSPNTLRERHAPFHPDRCYLRYWALLCSIYLEGTAGDQRRARAQARQQINTRAETCYGVYLDVMLLEARLAGQAPAVEGIWLMREHRIEN